jgi:hypothetical protein
VRLARADKRLDQLSVAALVSATSVGNTRPLITLSDAALVSVRAKFRVLKPVRLSDTALVSVIVTR